MKPIILTGLMLLLLLTSCSSSSDSSDVVPQPDNGNGNPIEQPQYPIGFTGVFADSDGGAAAYTTRGLTRGVGDGEFTNTELQASGFGVYCWYTDSSNYIANNDIKGITQNILMLNQHVIYSDGKWTYEPSKYWPLNADEKLTFRAYAPYVSYQLQTDETTGLPMLPVVVTKDDYHNGKQHDPLWGTSKHGGSDGNKGTTYGVLYNNYTYEMSGDSTFADNRDGVIDWYFHHGMAKLMFACSVIQDPGCDKVIIRSIQIENLYTQGLLSLSSATTSKDEKPKWEQRYGDMTVTLSEATPDNTIPGDLAQIPTPIPAPEGFNPYPFVITTSKTGPTTAILLLSSGLLVIPRDFSSDGLNVTITYTIDDDDTPLKATGTIKQNIVGNTVYTLGLSLTPSTRGLEISLVQSAFTPWHDAGTGEHMVYNW